jgi:hypothetical protein
MFRALSLPIVIAALAASAEAQSHPGSHPTSHPHDSLAHPAIDLALHALLHGTWTGTLTSTQGSAALKLSLSHNSPGQTVLATISDRVGFVGTGRSVRVSGDTLRWMQDVAGRSCPAFAILTPAEPSARRSMNGIMTCDGGDLRFVLRRSSE